MTATSSIIFGGATERFANMFNVETRRPMADGLLNPKERMGTVVLESIMRGLIPRAKTQGEVLSFSVPAATEGREAELVYHEASLRRFFETLGYRAVAINEGLAVIFSELEDQNFTGIGISCGGGMCNVALAYLSIPSLLFGISKGGDYIDTSVGSVVNEPSTRIKMIKEEKLDLTKPPADKLEKALHIYYEDLVESLVDSIRKAVARRRRSSPAPTAPLPIVIAGGAAKPRGFKELFETLDEVEAVPGGRLGDPRGRGPGHRDRPGRPHRRPLREVRSSWPSWFQARFGGPFLSRLLLASPGSLWRPSRPWPSPGRRSMKARKDPTPKAAREEAASRTPLRLLQ